MAAMLTTIDNPYNPKTQFDEWYAFDLNSARLGCRTDSCSLLARIANTSPQLSDELNAKIIEDAIDDIIKYDPFKVYKKVVI